jgi:hypothetical protein
VGKVDFSVGGQVYRTKRQDRFQDRCTALLLPPLPPAFFPLFPLSFKSARAPGDRIARSYVCGRTVRMNAMMCIAHRQERACGLPSSRSGLPRSAKRPAAKIDVLGRRLRSATERFLCFEAPIHRVTFRRERPCLNEVLHIDAKGSLWSSPTSKGIPCNPTSCKPKQFNRS